MTEFTWYPVLRLPLELDLLPLIQYLQSHGLMCHVTEESGEQQLWIADEHKIALVQELLREWQAGRLNIRWLAQRNYSKKPWLQSALQNLWLSPVTVVTLLLSLLGFFIVAIDQHRWVLAELFLFQPIYRGEIYPASAGWNAGQYWRLLTPIFLHMNVVHIVFNGLFFWLLGRRIEMAKGYLYLISLVLLIGIFSNIAQYLMTPNIPFGGLSGVVYGLLGYVGIYQRFISHPVLNFNRAAIVASIVFLLLGVAGVMDIFTPGDTGIANTAHVAGLVSGILLALVSVVRDRQQV